MDSGIVFEITLISSVSGEWLAAYSHVKDIFIE